MKTALFDIIVFAIFSTVLCSSCSNIQVTSKSFTTEDATIVSSIAYISEFTVKCGSGDIETLYAELDKNVVPVSIVGPNRYQVSWTEEARLAQSGDKEIRLLTEDGYTAYRKAIRTGEDTAAVPSLFSVTVNHPGTFSGPWLKSEFIATIISLVIAYFAIASRSKVLS